MTAEDEARLLNALGDRVLALLYHRHDHPTYAILNQHVRAAWRAVTSTVPLSCTFGVQSATPKPSAGD